MAIQLHLGDFTDYFAVALRSQGIRLPGRMKPWQLLFFELSRQQGDKPKFLDDMFFDAEEYPLCRDLGTELAYWMAHTLNPDGTMNMDLEAHYRKKYDALDPAVKAYVNQAVELAKKHFTGWVPELPAG